MTTAVTTAGGRRAAWGALIALLGTLLVVPAAGATPGRACRRACSGAIAACVAGGEQRRRCGRHLLRQCRQEGLEACGGLAADPLAWVLVPPASLAAMAPARRTITLTWRDPNLRETGYIVERSVDPNTFTPVASVGTNMETWSDGGLADATTYQYRVRARGRKGLLSAPSAIVGATTPAPPSIDPGAGPAEAGRVHFVKTASSSLDHYTSSPSLATQQWMREHYWRMLTYAPYFDSRLAWYPDAWVYQDLYAIYPASTLASQHPEWILRDASGTPLYIPFACSNGTCPQHAADIGDPGFRAWWIGEARARIAKGYRGLFVDDVNLAMKVADGTGTAVPPWDDRLGRAMTEADWRQYLAAFTEEIRAALPGIEIVHNQVWFFAPVTDPHVQRAIAAADVIELERGFNDTGIRGGTGQYGFETLAGFIDAVHAAGRGVLLDVEVSWGAEYALATYFLISSGRDGLANETNGFPDAWWTGYDTALGAPAGGRYAWNGLVRRDFEGGLVLVNQPEQPARTIDLGGTYRGLDGTLRARVTLGPADGVVLLLP